MIAPSNVNEWFTPVNARTIPTRGTRVTTTGGETGSEPPAPAPCQHERTVESLREWLSRQPFDGRVVVGDVLLRLGRRSA